MKLNRWQRILISYLTFGIVTVLIFGLINSTPNISEAVLTIIAYPIMAIIFQGGQPQFITLIMTLLFGISVFVVWGKKK
jgi:ABC-type transport system involved in multi-copper enzyme maturation permease subunit